MLEGPACAELSELLEIHGLVYHLLSNSGRIQMLKNSAFNCLLSLSLPPSLTCGNEQVADWNSHLSDTMSKIEWPKTRVTITGYSSCDV